MDSAAAGRGEDLRTDGLSGDRFEQGAVIFGGALAVRVAGCGRAIGTPTAHAFRDRIDESDGIAGAGAVCRADDFPHQFDELVEVAGALVDEVLAKLEVAATGASAFAHEFDQSRAVDILFLIEDEIRKELAHGAGVGHTLCVFAFAGVLGGRERHALGRAEDNEALQEGLAIHGNLSVLMSWIEDTPGEGAGHCFWSDPVCSYAKWSYSQTVGTGGAKTDLPQGWVCSETAHRSLAF